MKTWLHHHIQRNRLLYSLVLYILSISVALALLSAIVKFYLGYKKEVKKIDEVMILIHESYTDPINVSLWSFDYNQLKVQAQGILNLPYIKKVIITEQFEGTEKPVISLGEITDKSYVKQTFSIDFNSRGVMKHIGSLSVFAGLDQIRDEIKYQIGSGFIMMLVEILVLSLCMVFVVNVMVVAHLDKIHRFLRDSDKDTFGRTLTLDRKPERNQDVLDSIVGFINSIIERNISNTSRLGLMNQEMAEDRAKLEQCEARLGFLEKIKKDEDDVWAILRDHQSLESLAQNLLGYFCRYFGAGAGLFYIVDEDGGKITALSGYTIKVVSGHGMEFDIGKGQLGQAVLNKKPCIITSGNGASIQVQSSLGHAEPDFILIYPFSRNDRVFCALEMGQFKPFEQDKIILLDTMCECVAGAVETAALKERNAVLEKAGPA